MRSGRKRCGFSIKFAFTTDFLYWGLGGKYWPSVHLGPLHWWLNYEYRDSKTQARKGVNNR